MNAAQQNEGISIIDLLTYTLNNSGFYDDVINKIDLIKIMSVLQDYSKNLPNIVTYLDFEQQFDFLKKQMGSHLSYFECACINLYSNEIKQHVFDTIKECSL